MQVNKSNNTKRISRFAYPDTHSFVQAFARGGKNDYTKFKTDRFYFRNGSYSLAVEEQKIQKLVEAENVLLTTSGMSSVITALEIANLTSGDIVIHGSSEYGQSFDYISVDLAEKNIKSIKTDTGNITNIGNTIKQTLVSNPKEKIKVIFFETVGNGPEIPVLDIEKFLSLKILQDIDPLIIFDNTFPTNSTVQLARIIKKSNLKIIGLESATKFYLLNQDLGGILFTFNEDLFQKLLQKRKRIGATPGPSQISAYSQLLTINKNEFDENNRKTMRNTFRLARTCSQAASVGSKFSIKYPNLPNHPNFVYVQKNYSNGIAPVFFLTSLDPNLNSEQLFYLLEKHHAFDDIILSESFGFNTTTALQTERDGGYIRIAGGLEEDKQIAKIGNQIKNALDLIS